MHDIQVYLIVDIFETNNLFSDKKLSIHDNKVLSARTVKTGR